MNGAGNIYKPFIYNERYERIGANPPRFQSAHLRWDYQHILDGIFNHHDTGGGLALIPKNKALFPAPDPLIRPNFLDFGSGFFFQGGSPP